MDKVRDRLGRLEQFFKSNIDLEERFMKELEKIKGDIAVLKSGQEEQGRAIQGEYSLLT